MKFSSFYILIVGLAIFSCQNQNVAKKNLMKIDTNSKIEIPTPEFNLEEALTELFNNSISSDSIVFNNYQPFLFFKSGNILNKSNKNIIVVTCPTDSIYSIKLYEFKNKNWIGIDSINGLEAFPCQFDLDLKDYNFDNQTDLFIQVTASNGYSISKGHLIIIDANTKKLQLHPETRNFGNIVPNFQSKTIESEIWNGYNKKGEHQLTYLIHKWENGKLETIRKTNRILK